MATYRTRTHNEYTPAGFAEYDTGVDLSGSGGQVTVESAYCADYKKTVNEDDCQPLTISKWKMIPGRLNGRSGSATYSNFVPTVYRSNGNFPNLSMSAVIPSDSWLANNALARTNPSRPYVDVTAEVLQLTDFLYLIKSLGTKVLSAVGQANLNYQFGIAPLVDDLAKISIFMDQFGRRMLEMKRLQSKKGLRRTVQQGEFTLTKTEHKTIQSQGAVVGRTCTCVTTVKLSSHVRWYPTGDFAKLALPAVRLRTSEVMMGMLNGKPYADLKTLWEVIPWSWLIDYAVDISGYLKATRNIVAVECEGAYVMHETTTQWFVPGGAGLYGTKRNLLTDSAGQVDRKTKTRKFVAATPFAEMPNLSKNQMGILASLWVRGRR